MIVTFDTSILVRATKESKGPARKLLETIARNPQHIIVLSPFILREVERVLFYPRLQALWGLKPQEIREHVEHLRDIAQIIEPETGPPIIRNDPCDDPVLYTAISGDADVLCAKDNDFYAADVIAHCNRLGIAVMDDVSLLTLLSR